MTRTRENTRDQSTTKAQAFYCPRVEGAARGAAGVVPTKYMVEFGCAGLLAAQTWALGKTNFWQGQGLIAG